MFKEILQRINRFFIIKILIYDATFQIDEDLTARVNMADSKFSFQEVGRIYDPAWMSPEALTKKLSEINQEASDMWSFSIILWELATREIPFADLSPMECGMKVS